MNKDNFIKIKELILSDKKENNNNYRGNDDSQLSIFDDGKGDRTTFYSMVKTLDEYERDNFGQIEEFRYDALYDADIRIIPGSKIYLKDINDKKIPNPMWRRKQLFEICKQKLDAFKNNLMCVNIRGNGNCFLLSIITFIYMITNEIIYDKKQITYSSDVVTVIVEGEKKNSIQIIEDINKIREDIKRRILTDTQSLFLDIYPTNIHTKDFVKQAIDDLDSDIPEIAYYFQFIIPLFNYNIIIINFQDGNILLNNEIILNLNKDGNNLEKIGEINNNLNQKDTIILLRYETHYSVVIPDLIKTNRSIINSFIDKFYPDINNLVPPPAPSSGALGSEQPPAPSSGALGSEQKKLQMKELSNSLKKMEIFLDDTVIERLYNTYKKFDLDKLINYYLENQTVYDQIQNDYITIILQQLKKYNTNFDIEMINELYGAIPEKNLNSLIEHYFNYKIYIDIDLNDPDRLETLRQRYYFNNELNNELNNNNQDFDERGGRVRGHYHRNEGIDIDDQLNNNNQDIYGGNSLKKRIIKSIKSFLSSKTSMLAIAVLMGNMYTIIFKKKKIQYVKEIIILCLTILIIEYFRNKTKSEDLYGGSNQSSFFADSKRSLELLSNMTDMRKFYDVYTKNNLNKINLSKDDVRIYITELNKTLTSSFTVSEIKNNMVLKQLLSNINLPDTVKQVELQILNLNNIDLSKDKEHYLNLKTMSSLEEEDINIDEKEIYKKYKEITASLTGKLSKKSEELLLNKIKNLEKLKKKINNQYNEIIEYTKLLSGINKNNIIMNLDNTLSEETIHDYVINYKKLIKKENKIINNINFLI